MQSQYIEIYILSITKITTSLGCSAMNLKDVTRLVRLLEGQTISFKTLAANSLTVNFNGPPGSPDLWTLWLEPPWRYQDSGKVIVGSDDLPYPDSDLTEDESKAQFNEFSKQTSPIVGDIVKQIEIDNMSHDLTLKLTSGHTLRTFACGHIDESWRLISEVQRILIFPDRIDVEELMVAN